MKSLLVIMLVMFSIACSKTGSDDGIQKYEIICKHPIGQIVYER